MLKSTIQDKVNGTSPILSGLPFVCYICRLNGLSFVCKSNASEMHKFPFFPNDFLMKVLWKVWLKFHSLSSDNSLEQRTIQCTRECNLLSTLLTSCLIDLSSSVWELHWLYFLKQFISQYLGIPILWDLACLIIIIIRILSCYLQWKLPSISIVLL